jgi:nucleoside-diphosphate-sugar epimerase
MHQEKRAMKPLVLVTGIEGFTGALMREELESNGYRVVGTTLGHTGPGDYVLDVESADACKAIVSAIAPDFVIHLAGISFVQSDPARLYAANVVGTVNLLDALALAPKVPIKVVLASSANVYGNREGDRITEAEEPRPANHYAVSKWAMEKMAANFYDRLPIIITRPFNYTGVGQSINFLIPKIVSHFARGERHIELGNTDVERDFSDVEMVVQVYRKLLESQSRSVIVNICTGTATSLGSVIAMMEEIAGYRIEVRVNPAFVRPNDIRHLTGDPRAMRAATGEVETRPLRETLESMYRALHLTA